MNRVQLAPQNQFNQSNRKSKAQTIKMVDSNISQPLVSKRDTASSAVILPMASTTNQIPTVTQQSPRLPPPTLVDNFKNGTK